MRRIVIPFRPALMAALAVVSLCGGCAPPEDKDGANLVKPGITPDEQRKAIENGNYSVEEKQRYLQQVKEREMAEQMNPNKNGSAIPPNVKTN